MSRCLGRQGSLESPGAGYGASYERRFSEDEGKGHKAKLNRSLTISNQSTAARLSREPTSPLKRFAQAKDVIRRAFQHLGARVEESQAFVRAARQGSECASLGKLAQRTVDIQRVLDRDRMKVAFFGRTSNGKSSVINALLHGRVLPVGIGHTTNCFCSVVGVEGSEGYLLIGESEERRSVKVCSSRPTHSQCSWCVCVCVCAEPAAAGPLSELTAPGPQRSGTHLLAQDKVSHMLSHVIVM